MFVCLASVSYDVIYSLLSGTISSRGPGTQGVRVRKTALGAGGVEVSDSLHANPSRFGWFPVVGTIGAGILQGGESEGEEHLLVICTLGLHYGLASMSYTRLPSFMNPPPDVTDLTRGHRTTACYMIDSLSSLTKLSTARTGEPEHTGTCYDSSLSGIYLST